ncbi:hypothetical protein AVEN_62692-1 [Araneus ventricosus]|uniref:Uncharacterized protein n=1 Tax=Araneus ventricosus TaxID=182803 RepID=A0A4Y2FIJ9_ARAVE|nr:hypothetical protein AVEN_62692-1 [Araneus ventricosus]
MWMSCSGFIWKELTCLGQDTCRALSPSTSVIVRTSCTGGRAVRLCYVRPNLSTSFYCNDSFRLPCMPGRGLQTCGYNTVFLSHHTKFHRTLTT